MPSARQPRPPRRAVENNTFPVAAFSPDMELLHFQEPGASDGPYSFIRAKLCASLGPEVRGAVLKPARTPYLATTGL
jgi:hypothetical protein